MENTQCHFIELKIKDKKCRHQSELAEIMTKLSKIGYSTFEIEECEKPCELCAARHKSNHIKVKK